MISCYCLGICAADFLNYGEIINESRKPNLLFTRHSSSLHPPSGERRKVCGGLGLLSVGGCWLGQGNGNGNGEEGDSQTPLDGFT